MKRYLHEKIRFVQTATSDEHVLIVPGKKTEVVNAERSRIYFIHSPLVSRATQYRALLNLRALGEILEREWPDIIESSDPYQLGWKTISAGRALQIPVVAFYHSHFAEAHVRSLAKIFSRHASDFLMNAARNYVRELYRQFAATFVPSLELAETLRAWGVTNARAIDLGVNTEVFRALPADSASTRHALGIAPEKILLLYVGRLAPEKNTGTLIRSFEILARRFPARFELLVIGDGAEREELCRLRDETREVSWISYCGDSHELAKFYRAADLFVHPGVQETFGLVALEAQACGTPVVGIRGSRMDRIILHDQENWAAENSAEALATAIVRSVEQNLHNGDHELAARVAERFAWPKIFAQLFAAYREMIADFR